MRSTLIPPALPRIPGLEISARYHPAGDGTEVGAVTSAVRLPSGEIVALGYVRKEASQPGTKLLLADGARVVVAAG